MTRSPLFVTGTDTGVGKTTVARGLLRLASRERWPLFPLKPVETGCPVGLDGSIGSVDGAALAEASGHLDALAEVAPLRFELPAAPWVAARSAGAQLDSAALVRHIRPLAERSAVLIEGAGGLLVPLNARETLADLALMLRATVLVVARDALGTLNHTLLTVDAARSRGLPVAGVVLNSPSPDICKLDNRSTLQPFVNPVPIWGPLPWLENASDDALADALVSIGLDRRALEARWV